MRIFAVSTALVLSACAVQPEVPDAPIPTQAPSASPIYVNQLGFHPDSQKIAILRSASDTPLSWQLVNASGETVATGETLPLGYSARADQKLHRIEFSDVTQTGQAYQLVVAGEASPDFDIKAGLYAPLAKDAMAYFYHNRAGEPILAEHVGAAHARPVGHPKEVVTCFDGTDQWGTDWPGCDYALDVTGGWYDAGDHGKYVVNSGISVWTLLNAYERNPDLFPDGSLDIPEAGNGVPDILDEARQNIEFMLSMQVPDGQKVWVAVGQQGKGDPLELVQIDGGGLVHHKVHDVTWAGLVSPHENTATRYLYPPSTGATLNVAAIGAQCARIWQEVDPAFAARCQAASDLAIDAANRTHADEETHRGSLPSFNNFDGGGPYGDDTHDDEVQWVQSEEITTKRGPSALASLTDEIRFRTPSFSKTDGLGWITRAAFGPSPERYKRLVTREADSYLADMDREALYIPYAADAYRWGSNSNLANRAIVLGTAYDLTGDRKYRDGVLHLMDYMLGRNPLGQSYISGYGDRPFVNPHHRHWSASVRAGAPTVPPGVLSGGPNNDNMSDPVAKTQVGTCAAQTCWTDHYEAWTQNEVTINWNAPLVWMAAFLDDTE